MKVFLLSAFLVFLWVSSSSATFTAIRIGDVDGFGYGSAAGFQAANGGPANPSGLLLGPGDFLPDLAPAGGAPNGKVGTGNGDDFDNRFGEGITGSGFVDNGSFGSQFTDIALSTSYDASGAANQVFDANTNTFGSGGTFPMSPSAMRPNQPGFIFDFFVADGDIIPGTPLFLNMVFGDYEIRPANVRVITETATGLPLTRQNNAGGDNGLIQAVFTNLAFNEVFTPVAGGFEGSLMLDFVAPNEPYTAFDFVEIGVLQQRQVQAPEPATMLLIGTGLIGLAGFMRKFRK